MSEVIAVGRGRLSVDSAIDYIGYVADLTDRASFAFRAAYYCAFPAIVLGIVLHIFIGPTWGWSVAGILWVTGTCLVASLISFLERAGDDWPSSSVGRDGLRENVTVEIRTDGLRIDRSRQIWAVARVERYDGERLELMITSGSRNLRLTIQTQKPELVAFLTELATPRSSA